MGEQQHHFHADAWIRSTPACIIVFKPRKKCPIQQLFPLFQNNNNKLLFFGNETLAQVCKGTPSFGVIPFFLFFFIF